MGRLCRIVYLLHEKAGMVDFFFHLSHRQGGNILPPIYLYLKFEFFLNQVYFKLEKNQLVINFILCKFEVVLYVCCSLKKFKFEIDYIFRVSN